MIVRVATVLQATLQRFGEPPFTLPLAQLSTFTVTSKESVTE